MMAKRKKTFACGHKGLGQFCHQCQQHTQKNQQTEQKKQEKQDWNDLFSEDDINLSKLPSKKLVLKARHILTQIKTGTSYHQLNGKRLNYDKKTVSVPVNNDYRLLFRRNETGWQVFQLLSHEEYNVKKPGSSKQSF